MRSLVDGRASEAAEFDTGLFPDSRITERTVNPIDYTGGTVGRVIKDTYMLVGGRSFVAIDGFRHPSFLYI